MITLDFNQVIVDFDGKPLFDQDGEQRVPTKTTVGQIIAEWGLAKGAPGNTMKVMPWAQTLWENKVLMLDKVDCELLRSIVTNNTKIAPYLCYKIVKQIDVALAAGE